MTTNRTALVILSGGQDSTTCLFWAAQHFDTVHAVTFDYGQRHEVELEAAERVFDLAKEAYPEKMGTHEYIVVGKILRGTSPLVSDEPLEEYADHQSLPGGLEKTFVPGRNLLFLTLAANLAYSLKCTDLLTGVCQEENGGYPDCRQDFITAAQGALREGLSYRWPNGARDEFFSLTIHTPLMDLSKADSVRLARDLPGCFNALAMSHTAYDGKFPPTSKDHASLLRAKGFEEAGLPDPLVLRAFSQGAMNYLPKTPNYKDAVVSPLLDDGTLDPKTWSK